MSAQMAREYLFADRDRLIDAHAVEAGATPGLFRTFDDEGRGIGIELVGMYPDPAVLGFLENKGERVVELLMRAEPDIFAGAHIDVGLEMIGMARAHARIHAVGADDQVEIPIGLEVLRLGFELEIDAEGAGAILQDIQQAFASDAAKAVAGRGDNGIAIMHRDVVPIDEIFANKLRALRIVGVEVVERLARQDGTPARRIRRPGA